MNRKTIFGIVAIALLILTATAIAFLTNTITLNGGGQITTVNLEIYSDPTCTIPLTFLNYTSMSRGQAKGITTYVKVVGNTNATLHMTTGTWMPSGINAYMNQTWNVEGVVVQPNTAIVAVFTVAVASNMPTSYTTFSFSTTVWGEYQ